MGISQRRQREAHLIKLQALIMTKFKIAALLLTLLATSNSLKISNEVNDMENEILDDVMENIEDENNSTVIEEVTNVVKNIEDENNSTVIEDDENVNGTKIDKFFGAIGSILDSLGDTVSKIVDETIDIAGEVVESPQMENVTRSASDLLKNTGSLFKKVVEMKRLFRDRVVDTIRRRNDEEE